MKQGPFARLPLELKSEVLSWLKYENKRVQQRPRAVSRTFYQASARSRLINWCSKAIRRRLIHRIASGYLRRILRQENFTQTYELETFYVEHAPKMRAIDLTNSYRQKTFAKTALLHRLLSRRDVALQSVLLDGCTALLEVPQELTKVNGDLDLSRTGITQLPQGLTVGGDLDLSYSRITQLPQGLTVGGTLTLAAAASPSCPKG